MNEILRFEYCNLHSISTHFFVFPLDSAVYGPSLTFQHPFDWPLVVSLSPTANGETASLILTAVTNWT